MIHLQLQPTGEVSAEHPTPDGCFWWKLDWFVWRNLDFLLPFCCSDESDFPLVTSGSAWPLLGNGRTSGWWKRLWTHYNRHHLDIHRFTIKFLKRNVKENVSFYLGETEHYIYFDSQTASWQTLPHYQKHQCSPGSRRPRVAMGAKTCSGLVLMFQLLHLRL